jgi:hypothetical protein
MPIKNLHELVFHKVQQPVATAAQGVRHYCRRSSIAFQFRSQNMIRTVTSGFVLGVLVPFLQLQAAPAELVDWQSIGTGLEISRVSLDSNAFLSPELLMVKIDLKRYRFATVRGIDFGSHENDVRSLSRASKALVGINANFF